MPSLILRADTLRTLAAGGLSGSYAAVGPQFDHQVRIIKFFNDTDVDITFSFDGVNDHDLVPPQGFLLLDVSTNMVPPDSGWYIEKGTQIFAKGAATTGAIYVSAYFAKGQ